MYVVFVVHFVFIIAVFFVYVCSSVVHSSNCFSSLFVVYLVVLFICGGSCHALCAHVLVNYCDALYHWQSSLSLGAGLSLLPHTADLQ